MLKNPTINIHIKNIPNIIKKSLITSFRTIFLSSLFFNSLTKKNIKLKNIKKNIKKKGLRSNIITSLII